MCRLGWRGRLVAPYSETPVKPYSKSLVKLALDAAMRRGGPLDYAAVLRQQRDRTQLTQADFARLIGVGYSTYCSWEQGRRAPPPGVRTLLDMLDRAPEGTLAIMAGLEVLHEALPEDERPEG